MFKILMIVPLSSCSSLLEQDFNKATLVGELQLGSPETFNRSLTLPPGNAQLILAVPNYRCEPIKNAPITIVIRGPKGNVFSERLSLSQFTWSYGENSCHAYGYLREGPEKSQATSIQSDMRLSIANSKTPMTIEVDASQVKTSPGRTASLWFIYGDRVPSRKLFGDATSK